MSTFFSLYLKSLLSVALLVNLAPQIVSAQTSKRDKDSSSVISVSMVHLLTDPAFFEGQKVRVFGYFGDFAAHSLYLTKAHAHGLDVLSALRLPLPDSNVGKSNRPICDHHYVYVVGEVHVRPLIPYDVVSLYKVESIEIADGPEGDKFQVCYEAQP